MVQQQLFDLVSGLAPVRQSLSETPQLLSSPFHTVNDLEKFESELTPEQEKQAVRELTSLGGSSVRSAVRRILSHTFRNALAQQYSWEGRKGKLKFVELKFSRVIMRALQVQEKFSKASKYEVEAEIKEWLRHASERCKRAHLSEPASV
ncbi:uncharacterized protein LOC135387287 [Ornithodoros turicata]|uniref:uncharacterized protein LOC135387287 n=1 Tax=Ornithodoros turicata TaxID=34597 RepID=UPI003139B5BD